MNWINFESDCCDYLNDNYKSAATFIHEGLSNSTVPDILVKPNKGGYFYIEAKSPQAQCGQFVLVPNEESRSFDYSQGNSTPYFEETNIIIDHMNANFEKYIKAGTAGVSLPLSESVFIDWIQKYYSSKNVKFFITGTQKIIFPVENFGKYFSVSCQYRMKRSGSSNPSKNNLPEINTLLSQNGIRSDITQLGKEYYIKTQQNVDGLKIHGKQYSYILRQGVGNNFNIRRLSNTCNSNVIFQINQTKMSQGKADLDEFLASIN